MSSHKPENKENYKKVKQCYYYHIFYFHKTFLFHKYVIWLLYLNELINKFYKYSRNLLESLINQLLVDIIHINKISLKFFSFGSETKSLRTTALRTH